MDKVKFLNTFNIIRYNTLCLLFVSFLWLISNLACIIIIILLNTILNEEIIYILKRNTLQIFIGLKFRLIIFPLTTQ